MGRLKRAARSADAIRSTGIARAEASTVEAGHLFDWLLGSDVFSCRVEGPCQLCGAVAIVALPAPLLAQQPDDTTHVCHPVFGGCNHGFALDAGAAPIACKGCGAGPSVVATLSPAGYCNECLDSSKGTT